jgi:type III secretory pathway lipoprotein EscJ
MRIKIKDSVVTIPDKLIKEIDQLDVETANAINTLLAKGERIISQRKQDTAREALKIKVSKTKEKIQNAINLLRLQGKPINAYQVAKLSGVAYNTAKKYVKNSNI